MPEPIINHVKLECYLVHGILLCCGLFRGLTGPRRYTEMERWG